MTARAFLAAALLPSALLTLRAQVPAPAVPPAMQQEYARDPHQAINESYTAAIAKDTTEPYFNSPLTNYLPDSKTVPPPSAVLGDIAGAPGKLPYAEDVAAYFRMLEKSTPRVKVFSIGKSEEGREMIAVAVGDETLLKQLDANDARLAQLADPRKSKITDAQAAALARQSFPVYYITGTIHSTETGAPTALMELAYRLAVDNAPYIQAIRQHMVTLITPVVEVDGRDRMVDLYKWHLAHPGETYPRLVYWGHYVAHDNNRDAMAMTLDLTQHVLDTFLHFHAQVLHDLHESVPFLYDNTVGDGPYNSWIDPLLADEWAALGWNNVGQMQNFGMPGVFTHGEFDTWSPGYLMFLAGMHNGISRLYETFGNGGADTERRILSPEETDRTWYKQNPPLTSVLWSQRDNNNYEQSALLTTLSYFAANREHFLDNYYLKAKRSIGKPATSGPAAYVLAADPAYRSRQIDLLRTLVKQHVEVARLTAATTVSVSASDHAAALGENAPRPSAAKPAQPVRDTFPAGSWVVRMDQPFSRVADALLDRQYWAPDDPQKTPYDDTAWSFSLLFNARVTRVTDPAILAAPMTPDMSFGPALAAAGIVSSPQAAAAPQPAAAAGGLVAISNSAQTGLLALAYALPGAKIQVLDEATKAGGQTLAPGSLIVADAGAELPAALRRLGLDGDATPLPAMPTARMHPLDHLPRIAMMHTWLATQTEGWWRQALDALGIPYATISTQTAAAEADLRAKYDVILFAPVTGRTSSAQIVEGLPLYGTAQPWQTTPLTPNLGRIDSTPDIRPGLGQAGLAHLRSFVEAGGLLITSEDTAQFAIANGLAPGVSVAPTTSVKLVGSILGSVILPSSGDQATPPPLVGSELNAPALGGPATDPATDKATAGMQIAVGDRSPGTPTRQVASAWGSPITYGYAGSLPVYSEAGLAFNVSNLAGGGGQLATEKNTHRVTGRGGPNDDDAPEDRTPEARLALPNPEPWQPTQLNEEQARNNPYLIPAALRPDVLVRFADGKNLLLSGLLENPEPLAAHAAVVDAHLGQGNVLLFAINPIYRGETIGTYALVFNAILNHDRLAHLP